MLFYFCTLVRSMYTVYTVYTLHTDRYTVHTDRCTVYIVHTDRYTVYTVHADRYKITQLCRRIKRVSVLVKRQIFRTLADLPLLVTLSTTDVHRELSDREAYLQSFACFHSAWIH